MQIISNSFPLRPAAEAARPATETAKVVQFMTEAAQQLIVQDADGFIDYAADLTVRALAAAAAVGCVHDGPESVFTALGDMVDLYTDTARAYMDDSRTSRRTDLHERAAALDTAVDRLTEIIAALAAEFLGVISVRATWSPGGRVEVFDYSDEGDPMGTYVPLDPPATAVDTPQEATRQLAERRFVVVGDWQMSTGKIYDVEFVEYHAALRSTLSF
jgi:hypothetical protein